MINEHSIHGEPNTGYEDENGLGPFECENCHYYTPLIGHMGACHQTEMLIYSRQRRVPGSTKAVIVDPEGCCEYVERTGKKKAGSNKGFQL